MKIAIDYDKTYTADPELWDLFIMNAQARGHIVFIATARSATRDINDQLRALQERLPVYFCDGVAKRFWCLHFGPGEVDIWIDDKPEGIDQNSTFPFSELQDWRLHCHATEPGHPGPLPYAHLGEPAPEPIPAGVYLNFDAGEFVSRDGESIGDTTAANSAFYAKWYPRWREFPLWEEKLEHYKPEDVAIRNGRAV